MFGLGYIFGKLIHSEDEIGKLIILTPSIEQENIDGKNRCYRKNFEYTGEGFLVSEGVIRRQIFDKSLRIAGFFTGSYEPRASLTVNDITIDIKKSENGGAEFDEIVEFDFKPGENHLLFKAKHPEGENILKECYIQYQLSDEKIFELIDKELEKSRPLE